MCCCARRPKKNTGKANESADEAKARLDAEAKQEKKNAKRAAKEAFQAMEMSSPASTPTKKGSGSGKKQRCESTLARTVGQKGTYEGVKGTSLLHQISVIGSDIGNLNADPPVTAGLLRACTVLCCAVCLLAA